MGPEHDQAGRELLHERLLGIGSSLAYVNGPVFMKLQGRVLYRLEDLEAFEFESLRKSTSERAHALAAGDAQ